MKIYKIKTSFVSPEGFSSSRYFPVWKPYWKHFFMYFSSIVTLHSVSVCRFDLIVCLYRNLSKKCNIYLLLLYYSLPIFLKLVCLSMLIIKKIVCNVWTTLNSWQRWSLPLPVLGEGEPNPLNKKSGYLGTPYWR